MNINYNAPTPETDAFISQIDDSEIDLMQVEAFCKKLECERDAVQANAAAMREELDNWRKWGSGETEATRAELARLRDRNIKMGEVLAETVLVLHFYGPQGDFDLGCWEEKMSEDAGDKARELLERIHKM